jgi:hypothetical protein
MDEQLRTEQLPQAAPVQLRQLRPPAGRIIERGR